MASEHKKKKLKELFLVSIPERIRPCPCTSLIRNDAVLNNVWYTILSRGSVFYWVNKINDDDDEREIKMKTTCMNEACNWFQFTNWIRYYFIFYNHAWLIFNFTPCLLHSSMKARAYGRERERNTRFMLLIKLFVVY